MALVLAGAAFSGCGGSSEPGWVRKQDVEQIAMDQLSAGATRSAPKITCPADLHAVVGTKMTCSMPLDGKPYDVTITVTSVRGTTTKFDVDVANDPS